jgi:hypothetical protein
MFLDGPELGEFINFVLSSFGKEHTMLQDNPSFF